MTETTSTSTRRGFLIGAGAVTASALLGAAPPAGDRPALVVGSGYGGAVAALRLAQAGIPVTLLEMGEEWSRAGQDGRVFAPVTKPDDRSFWLRSRTRMPVRTFLGVPVDRSVGYRTGVLDAEEFPGITVYQGRGVGGGSLVNGGMALTPGRHRFASILPTVDERSMYDTYFPRALRELGVSDIDPGWFERARCYRYARLGRQQAGRAGLDWRFVPNVYDWRYMEAEQAGSVTRSALAGQVLFGNDHGKQDLTRTYLARARATGRVTVLPLHRAVAVRRLETGAYAVEVHRTDTAGVVQERKTLVHRSVFLAAGSVGTTKLLVAARGSGALPMLSPEVGRGWGDNGNVMVGRANHAWAPTGALQSTIPCSGIDAWDTHGAFVEVAPMPTGVETWISLYLAITKTDHRGEFRWNAATGTAELQWSAAWKQDSVAAARSVLDRVNRTEGTIYRSDLFGKGRTWQDQITYHPLGGALLDRVTDGYGRVRGYPGLYVVDGALLPGNVTVNPFVTITALAERNIERVIAEDRLR